MNNQPPVAGLQTQLEELQVQLAALKGLFEMQQAELTALREAQAHKNATSAAIASAAPPQLKTPDTSRRQLLKRMGLVVLAGGAALGIASATYAPAEAKFSINPTSKIGAVITRTGASITNIPNTPNFGLIASPDASLSLNAGIFGTLIDASYIGICGLTSANSSSVGVAGYSNTGTGVYGKSDSWYGVRGNSESGTGVSGFSSSGAAVDGQSYGPDGYGVYGRSLSGTGVAGVAAATTGPAISAKNTAATNNGVALQIEQGGFTVKNAGIGTQTAAFIHQTTAGNTNANHTYLNNLLCNARPTAILFVSHNLNPEGGSLTANLNKALDIYYDTGNSKWSIALADGTTMPTGHYFNVLIINP